MKIQYVGVDISKNKFDVYYLYEDKLLVFNNDSNGISQFIKTISYKNVVILEYTGRYHVKLLNALIKARKKISIVSGTKVRRYAQMRFSRIKTDKTDAVLLANFGRSQTPLLFKKKSECDLELMDLFTYLNTLIKNRRNFTNSFNALKISMNRSSVIETSQANIISDIDNSISKVKMKISSLGKKHYSDELKFLTTIPGIGIITGCMLLSRTNGLRNFSNSRQLSCYFGLTPRINSSGLKYSMGRISKMGDKHMRKQLYMCAITALQHNEQCKILYNRLLKKGKPKKKAILAVANKLTRQCFATVKYEHVYDRNK